MAQNRCVEDISADETAVSEERHDATISFVIHEYFRDRQALTSRTSQSCTYARFTWPAGLCGRVARPPFSD